MQFAGTVCDPLFEIELDVRDTEATTSRALYETDRLLHRGVDAIIGPTTQGPAFALGEKTDDPVAMYLNDIYTIAANLAGLPALSMPAGLVDGKPVGVQLIGKAFDETGILSLAHQFQSLTDHHVARPEGF